MHSASPMLAWQRQGLAFRICLASLSVGAVRDIYGLASDSIAAEFAVDLVQYDLAVRDSVLLKQRCEIKRLTAAAVSRADK